MDKSAAAAVELALKTTGMNQQKLASKLKVSPGQISKWKNGEYMSHDMEKKIKELAGLGDHFPEFVAWAGSLEAAEKWDKLLLHLAAVANDGGETGYDTYPLSDEARDLPGILAVHTIDTLNQLGVEPPKQFPDELNAALKGIDADTDDDPDMIWLDDPYVSLVNKIYRALTDVWGFYVAYVQELIEDEDLDLRSDYMDFEPCLMELAASKIEGDKSFAPKFSEFQKETRKQYRNWCTEIKRAALKGGVPIRAEIMDMVNEGHESLGHEAEAEAFGFNDSRLHPDIYMNELLVGMRTIHQVLPAIMKKLGMDEKDFTLDESELHGSSSPR